MSWARLRNIYIKFDINIRDDMVPIKENSPAVALIYGIFIFLTTFFIMNLFISVIVDKFNEERQWAQNFIEEQKEFLT